MYGTYSWGKGFTTHDQRGTGVASGLTQEKSLAIKIERAEVATKAAIAYFDAVSKQIKAEGDLEKAKKSGDATTIKEAEEKLEKAKAEAEKAKASSKEADDKAREDPNNGGTTRGAREPSACAQALEGARELLRECHRTQWKDIRCQQLLARMNDCPDPTTILVDPEQGYSCGAKVDPEAAKDAWVAKCEERAKFGPDTGNPCNPPTLDSEGFGKGAMGDICGSPYAQHDPDNNECSTVTIGGDGRFGDADLQEMIIVFFNKFGGPLVVLPKNPEPPPRPGADPRPLPRP